tara:strand:+ start:5931 stop:7142 length:1212 start_codon:yes stop_codon:yes gene_type:complete
MGLVKESNSQYYSGQKILDNTLGLGVKEFTFPNYNTELVSAFGLPEVTPGVQTYTRIGSTSNFEIYHGTGSPLIFNKIDEDRIRVKDSTNNTIEIASGNVGLTDGFVMCQLTQPAINSNYGGYSWIPLNSIIDNFLFAYVGEDKILPKVRRNDVIFHAKRTLQELSYDVLKVIKSQELTIPPSLSVPIPQDFVNQVALSWADSSGVMHPIYPLTGLSGNPYDLPIQDNKGIPTQDSFENNIDADQSIIENRWKQATSQEITGDYDAYNQSGVFDYVWWKQAYGQRYGLNPSTSQENGWYSLNERTGRFSFSSTLANRCIILEYVSDGLAYDDDMRIPKVVEDAMYASIMYSLLSVRKFSDPGMLQFYKREKYAKTRNAKIRLQDFNLETLTQAFRNQSKWIKH